MFFQFVFFSGLVRQLITDYAMVGNIVFTFLLCLMSGRLTERENRFIVAILGIFFIINITPTLMFGFAPKLFLGYTGRIFLGALIIIYFKRNFFHVFERLVFVLAFISLPLFVIQVIYVHFFDIFESFSSFLLSDERLNSGRYELSGHRYLFVFLVNAWGQFRNSGFMWEPAAFGSMLAWATVINVFVNRFVLNTRLIVFFVVAITTFSIGTYVYFTIIIVIYLSRNIGNKNALLFLFSISILTAVFYHTDFTRQNIEMMERKLNKEQYMVERIQRGASAQRVSRVGGFFGNIETIIKTPFGFGASYELESYLYETPNGFLTLLRNWGIFSLLILIYCSYQIIKKLENIYKLRISPFQTGLLMVVILLPIAGNPYYNQPFLFAFLFSGFMVWHTRSSSMIKPLKTQKDRKEKLYA